MTLIDEFSRKKKLFQDELSRPKNNLPVNYNKLLVNDNLRVTEL